MHFICCNFVCVRMCVHSVFYFIFVYFMSSIQNKNHKTDNKMQHYSTPQQQVIYKKEQAGVKQYRVSVNNLRKVMPTGVGKPQQVHSDAVPLYLEAAAVKPAFDRVVRVELQARYSKLSGGKVCVSVCERITLTSKIILHLISCCHTFFSFFFF